MSNRQATKRNGGENERTTNKFEGGISMFWKPYEQLSDWQQEEAREAFPEEYAELMYHYDGVTLAIVAK